MVELAEIFHRYGPAYREKFGDRMPASHLKAMADIEACRTESLGGHVYACTVCDEILYSYHSCRNRHCPKCQHDAAQEWLKKQQDLLLPTPYFMVTFTLPSTLRDVARSNQKSVYSIFFRAAAAALQELAQDPRFVGAQIGMMSILQTWTRDLIYHPHLHMLVPGGGLTKDGESWLSSCKNFLVHAQPLSILFRAKFRDALKQTDLYALVPKQVWSQDWVVDCRHVGNGQAALRYLVPYVFRVAISNNRILKLENDKVTFRYKDGDTGKTKRCTVHAEEFIRRFLQHVLPKGFVKIRYYGLLSPNNRSRLHQARQLLLVTAGPAPLQALKPESSLDPAMTTKREIPCPNCGQLMHHVKHIRPHSRSPPG